MTVTPIQTRPTGFSAGVASTRKAPVKSSHNIDVIRRSFDVTIARPFVMTGHLSTIVYLDSMAKSIANGFTRLSIALKNIAVGAAIPADIDTLETAWESDRQYPYESNLYTGKVDETFSVPIVPGRYIIDIKISGSVLIPPQDEQQHLNVNDRLDLSGVPASNEEQYLTSVVTSLGDIINQTATEISKLNDIISKMSSDTPIDYTATLSNMKTSISSISDKLDLLHGDLA